MAIPARNEFSRPISPENLGEKSRVFCIEANADERSRLAERLGLDGLESLSAEISLTPRGGGRIVRLEGAFKALVRQTCVVTLEPVEDQIEGTLERLYDTAFEALENGTDYINMECEDPPDPLVGGEIDAGEAVAEQLALEINPFPRKKGTTFADYSAGPDGGVIAGAETVENAAPSSKSFAGLEKLRNKLKK